VGTRRDPLGVSELAEHGTPDLNRVRPPFIQVLVQKSVTTITNLAGRLTTWMLSESCGAAQGVQFRKLAPRLRVRRVGFPTAFIEYLPQRHRVTEKQPV